MLSKTSDPVRPALLLQASSSGFAAGTSRRGKGSLRCMVPWSTAGAAVGVCSNAMPKILSRKCLRRLPGESMAFARMGSRGRFAAGSGLSPGARQIPFTRSVPGSPSDRRLGSPGSARQDPRSISGRINVRGIQGRDKQPDRPGDGGNSRRFSNKRGRLFYAPPLAARMRPRSPPICR